MPKRAQEPQNENDEQDGADNAAAANRAKARITEAAAGKKHYQKYDQEKGHE
jgi:hypothetical protein